MKAGSTELEWATNTNKDGNRVLLQQEKHQHAAKTFLFCNSTEFPSAFIVTRDFLEERSGMQRASKVHFYPFSYKFHISHFCLSLCFVLVFVFGVREWWMVIW